LASGRSSASSHDLLCSADGAFPFWVSFGVLAPFVVGAVGDAAAGAGEADDGGTLCLEGAWAGLPEFVLNIPGVFIGGLGIEGPLGRPVKDGLMTVGADLSEPTDLGGC